MAPRGVGRRRRNGQSSQVLEISVTRPTLEQPRARSLASAAFWRCFWAFLVMVLVVALSLVEMRSGKRDARRVKLDELLLPGGGRLYWIHEIARSWE